ncbi:heavy metal translocating P-type ATPase [Alicyclobacillus sp. ALC3]|uniref:heavy metal translocating P-type ATPase n=1 Tax=Alicyclobacillus sp. ALC3 TaxID=2796143 RepID=UPI0023784035|nr:heavy metal translocating P-type ATPase [Alicyclobacillus sp. ALC3]WDL98887.1 copper-translocating P-type ATPase [Alicyclobacillus sp. ALC3]
MATKNVELVIEGMHCASCARAIEKGVSRQDGVEKAELTFATEKLHVAFDPKVIGVKDIKERVEKIGFKALLESEVQSREEAHIRELRQSKRRLFIAWILGIPVILLMIALWIFPNFHVLPFNRGNAWFMAIFTTPIVLYGGWKYYVGAYQAIRYARTVTTDVLITIGALSSYLYSIGALLLPGSAATYFDTATLVVAFISTGNYLKIRATYRSSEAIRSLVSLQARFARSVRDGVEQEIPIDQVAVGDLIRVRPGERVPVDGVVIGGSSFVDEAALTGESKSVRKETGTEVFASTMNQNGSLLIEVTKIGRETMLSQIIRLVEQAQTSKVPIVEFSDRLSRVFVPLVLGLGAITFIAWLVFYTGEYRLIQAISHMVAVLVIACPCALTLAPGTAVMVSTGEAAKRGILIKNVASLEAAHKLKHIVFDKTGTLTEGKPSVTSVIGEHVLSLAGAVEQGSEHPLGRAIVEHTKKQGQGLRNATDIEALPGRGIVGTVDGKRVFVGTTILMTDQGFIIPLPLAKQKQELENQGHTVVWVSTDEILGLIAVRDNIKSEAKSVIESLQQSGITVTMLTGDNRHTATAIAKELGIDHVVAEVLPQDKAQIINELQEQYGLVAMVGDGINDAPALVQADIGIAMGTGTDIANEASDITLIHGELGQIPFMIELSRKVYRTIRQNFIYAFLFNGIGLPFAGLGILGPVVASASMGVSSFIVVGNSMRLKARLKGVDQRARVTHGGRTGETGTHLEVH